MKEKKIDEKPKKGRMICGHLFIAVFLLLH